MQPTTPAVRRYLREFLSDPRVIDINAIGRALLLHLRDPAVSPGEERRTRTGRSGTPSAARRCSPFARISRRAVQAPLGDGWRVELAMRYGNPSIAAALERCVRRRRSDRRAPAVPAVRGVVDGDRGRAGDGARDRAAGTSRAIDFVPAFYDDPGFLAAWDAVAAPALAAARPDHVLFSFHGLPERQIHKSDPTGRLPAQRDLLRPIARTRTATAPVLRDRACARGAARRHRLHRVLPVAARPHAVDHAAHRRPARRARRSAGKKRLAVLCPAFVADCLETLEEIGIRAREQFKAAGGEELVLVPSLNATPRWVDAVAAIAERHAARKLLPVAV